MDDYLALCAQQGREPELPLKGSFSVRTGSDLHRRAAMHARARGVNLTRVVAEALERYLAEA
ncbi:MAG: toxin-antitoxin system HicB family antitoxin [Candidatus Latescibacterota bacterium]